MDGHKAVELGFHPLGILGLFGFLVIAWFFSRNRKAINYRLVGVGLSIQFILALIVMQPVVQESVFRPIDKMVTGLLDFAKQGATFVFKSFATGGVEPALLNFACWVLPTVIFFSAIMTILYHLNVMQPVVRVIARIMQKLMGTSGSESMACSANIFMGQTEAPLLVKPFVKGMTKSELHAVMVGGFGTVAGGVLALYASVLQGIDGIAGHLITASVMAAPGALVISKILYPETEPSETMGELKAEIEKPDSNVIEAAARGASEGMGLLINIIAMLIAFVSLISMFDFLLGKAIGITFTQLLGYVFTPFAVLMGVPWAECSKVGGLLGQKIMLTELVAYTNLSEMVKAGNVLSHRSEVLCSYALCGFANFASIGIQIGGIGAMAPERRKDLAGMGVSAMFGGMLVTCCTATIAGILIK